MPFLCPASWVMQGRAHLIQRADPAEERFGASQSSQAVFALCTPTLSELPCSWLGSTLLLRGVVDVHEPGASGAATVGSNAMQSMSLLPRFLLLLSAIAVVPLVAPSASPLINYFFLWSRVVWSCLGTQAGLSPSALLYAEKTAKQRGGWDTLEMSLLCRQGSSACHWQCIVVTLPLKYMGWEPQL